MTKTTANGPITLSLNGKVIGVARSVTFDIDPLMEIEVRGTFPDGTAVTPATFDVPQSVVDQGGEAIKAYIFSHYGRR